MGVGEQHGVDPPRRHPPARIRHRRPLRYRQCLGQPQLLHCPLPPGQASPNQFKKIQPLAVPARTEVTKWKEKIAQSLPRAYVSWWGEAGLDAAFPFPFPLAAAAVAEGSSDLREEADGGRLLVRRPGGAAEAAELMAKFAAELLGARE